MDVVQSLVADIQATKAVRPSDGTFHYPSGHAQAATVLGATPRDQGTRATALEYLAVELRIIAAVALHQCWTAGGPAAAVSNREPI